jgi:hypothetical protein
MGNCDTLFGSKHSALLTSLGGLMAASRGYPTVRDSALSHVIFLDDARLDTVATEATFISSRLFSLPIIYDGI